ncbi:MAG: methyltransferase domain-containing protein [Planctomycetota bacterium]
MNASFGRLHRRRFVPKKSWPEASVWDLACELLARLGAPTAAESNASEAAQLLLLTALRNALDAAVETPKNRLSLSNIAELSRFTVHCIASCKVPVRGAVHLDVGCGAINPFARMFTHMMAGVQRAYCLELDDIDDESDAVRMLARLATGALLDPRAVFGNTPITRREILDNVADFDLARLAAGDRGGMPERLAFLKRSAADTGLPDRSVDLVVTQSVLEHLSDVDAVFAELARITRPGGFGIHGVDTIDHRWYGRPDLHPLEFLTIASNERIVHESNRLRLFEFEELFARHGFRVRERWKGSPVAILDSLRQRLVEPWRSMPDEKLAMTWTSYCLQKE